VTVHSTDPLASQLAAEFAPQRRVSGWLGAFGAIALLLAALGLYGVIAQDVLQRTRELAVRAALGASPRALVALVLRGGVGLTIAGALVGTAGALLIARALRSMFSGLGVIDPRAFIASVALLVLVALVAMLLPAIRIVRLDAARALKTD
jgi:ABC-type antimicrobial peptide transport system permease subunit